MPFEVKYRAEADGFKSLYNLMEKSGFVTRVFDDARVYPEGDLGFLTGVAGETVTHAGGVLTDKFREWLVGSEVLALKAHRMPWLFVVPGRKA
ncbi:hypothetical protein [Deinococcus kurensis]|uniref:hypothetical protein n=1 Tax=Deinococcus kurensis TaxID=2662757 RepID=UPI0012D2E488|nr:hypothetical protein [Deinococcus kurensis]